MDWFSPKCPVTDKEKGWIERNLRWFLDEFGWRTVLEVAVVLPEPEFFPDPYDGSYDCVRRLVDRVCGYMRLDPGRVTLEIFEDPGRAIYDSGFPLGRGGSFRGPAGEYVGDLGIESGIIRIESSLLDQADSLIATIAHELGHLILLGEGRLTGREKDQEELTELLTVFYGLGVIKANAVFTRHDSWRSSLLGYLPEAMYGQALASFAWMRNEKKPAWAGYLDRPVRADFKQALRYLQKSRDTELPVLGLDQVWQDFFKGLPE